MAPGLDDGSVTTRWMIGSQSQIVTKNVKIQEAFQRHVDLMPACTYACTVPVGQCAVPLIYLGYSLSARLSVRILCTVHLMRSLCCSHSSNTKISHLVTGDGIAEVTWSHSLFSC